MDETNSKSSNYVKRKTSWDAAGAVASFFLGIALVLIIFAVFMVGFNFILSIFISLVLFLLFLTMVMLTVRPTKNVQVVKKQPVVEVKEEIIKEEKAKNFVGSSEAKTYHKSNCRFAKLIKSQFKDYSDDVAFFKKRKYKACKVCMKK